jgi:signal transduction histidine kinase
VNVPDVSRDPDYVVGWADARSELVVPLVLDEHVIGVFDLQSAAQRPRSRTAEARNVAAFAERAALALRLAELVGAYEERTRVLEAVARATQLLNFRLHAPDVLTSVVEETTRAFPAADGAVAWVADAPARSLSVAAVFGVGVMTLHAGGTAPRPVSRLKSAGRAFRENRPVFTNVEGWTSWPKASRSRRGRRRERLGRERGRALRSWRFRSTSATSASASWRSCPSGRARSRARTARRSRSSPSSARSRSATPASSRSCSGATGSRTIFSRTSRTRSARRSRGSWAGPKSSSTPAASDPTARRALEAILGQADTLSRMLADLIDLSRIDNFGLELRRERVRLSETVAAALDAVAPGAAKRGVTIRCHIERDLPAMEGDPARLKQVAWNLLANGVKFSPAGGTVDVTARRSGDGGLELVVADEGHGIEPEFLPHVFERFRQEETSSSRRYGGLGVGLSIARAIAEAHGGTIAAESEGREKGSRFRVTFPRERVVAPAVRGAPHGSGR